MYKASSSASKSSKLTSLKSFAESQDSAELDRRVSNVEKYLPSYKPSMDLLINLTRLARREEVLFSGLTLSPGKVKVSEEEVEEVMSIDLKTFTTSITMQGSRENLLSFISLLEEMSPIIQINSLSTSFSDPNDEYGHCHGEYDEVGI